MEDKISISTRKQEILFKGVENYIATGEPITSSELKQNGINASSATIRSELSSLDELGFLKQMHTSGGRVPTEKGYMAYVASLASSLPAKAKDLSTIKKHFLTKTTYLSQLIRDVAKVVSDTINYPSVVLMDGFSNFVIKTIKIVPLLSNNAFVLIETNMGIIDPIILTIEGLNEEICTEASLCLTNNFAGQSINVLISNINEASKQIQSDLKAFEEIFKNVVDLLKSYIDAYEQNIVSSGTDSLLRMSDLKESGQVKALIDFIENDSQVSQALKDKSEQDVEIRIGNNEQIKDSGGFGLVKAKCIVNGINIGSIAIVGPQRMDYLKIASSLKYIASEFERIEDTTSGKEDKK